MINNYLLFNGNCSKAIELYQKALGAKILEIKKYSDVPKNENFPINEDKKDWILNSKIEIDNKIFMLADSNEKIILGNNIYISILVDNEKYVKNAWELLSEDAEIYIELKPSFFAKIYGSLRDKFGINWMFTVLKPH